MEPKKMPEVLTTLNFVYLLEGNGTPLQYSCLENPMEGGAWWATVHGLQRVGHDWATSRSRSLHWKDWCWSWNSDTLATWCKEPTHWKRPWCWERLKAGGEGDDRGWDGWMASLTRWTWVWVGSGTWWQTGKPRVLQSMGSQRVGCDWATELNY